VIVPQVAGAAAPELDDLRLACDTAIDRMLAAEPEIIFVVGGGPETTEFGPADHGSLRPYGVDRRIQLMAAHGAGVPGLPLSLQIGAWLLHRAGAGCLRLGCGVAAGEPAAECERLGVALVAAPDRRVALLVMGDGSACRGEKAPGYDDPRAQPYDDGVAAALAGADAEALLGLDPVLSTELKVAGRAPWQVLAGAVRAAGGAWRGALSYHAAPYGVAYFVANWQREVTA
jgi:hypothetical protein